MEYLTNCVQPFGCVAHHLACTVQPEVGHFEMGQVFTFAFVG